MKHMFNLSLGFKCLQVAEWLRQNALFNALNTCSGQVRVRPRFISAPENWNKPRIEPSTSELKG